MNELEDIYNQILAAIKEDDNEKAHVLESILRNRALEMIAEEPPSCDCSHIAKFALKTSGLRFYRWFA